MTSGGVPLLIAQKVTKSFLKGGTRIHAVRGVDLEIRTGEMVAITGSSGVGKSTLLHVLGTLEPPSSGKVFFGIEREDIFAYSEKQLSLFRNQKLGFVFQFHYLLPEFSALENVMMPALIAGHSPEPARRQAEELLRFVGLDKRVQHRPAELSGGEQQRVAIARSVILRPQLLLADELTGNLDSKNGALVLELLQELNRETGVSILLVTHDLNLASKMHRVLVMQDGLFTDSA